MRSLEGQVALVTGGGNAAGRAVALALSARGVRIVVSGREEKALGVTVGEVVHGGGKARHVVADVRDEAQLGAVLDRAVEVFGRLDIVVAADPATVEHTFRGARGRLPATGGRLVAVLPGGDHAAALEVVRSVSNELAAHGAVTSNAVLLAGAPDDVADDAAELVVFLCSRSGRAITGQSIAVGHAVRTPAEV